MLCCCAEVGKEHLMVTCTLFVNAQHTCSPVKYPYWLAHRLLLPIWYFIKLYDVEKILINVGIVNNEKPGYCHLTSMSQ